MRKNNREKIIDLTMSILDIIDRFGGAAVYSFVDQKSVYRSIQDDLTTREKIRRKISSLINSGNLEAVEEGGKKSVRLTRKGKIKLIEKSSKNNVDGKWRLISFDIPESIKTNRVNFTRGLKRFGYRAVQKSLWVSPFVESQEIGLLMDELGINEYVARFTVADTDIEQHLREIFDDVL